MTVLLSLPRSNSPIRKEERLAIKLRTDLVPCGFFDVAFFGQPAKCEVAHTYLRLFPIKIQQPGNQEGTHGTKTSYRRRDCSCNGVDHPNGHGVGHAELVTDFRSSTFAFVLGRVLINRNSATRGLMSA